MRYGGVAKKTHNIVYISYNGTDNPLLRSQVIPYLKALSRDDRRFFFISFEKDRPEEALRGEFARHNIRWYALRYHRWPRICATAFDVVAGIIVTVYVGIRYRIDVIHARSYVPQVIACTANVFLRKKLIFDMRGFMVDEYREAGFIGNPFLYRALKRLERFLLSRRQAIVALTHKHAQELRAHYPTGDNPITVIPCSIDTEAFAPSCEKAALRKQLNLPDGFILVYSGSLGSWYEAGHMFDFFAVLAKAIPHAHFLLLTRSWEAFEKACKEKKELQSRVIARTVTYADMPLWLAASDCGIAFYKQTYSKQATSPVKAAEYLSCGLPVVVNHGLGDIAGYVKDFDLGAVVLRYNEEEYARAVTHIVALYKEADAPSRRARDFACTHYNLRNAEAMYRSLYENLITS
jgi:glycosyltransferase involved in cell wall biosynthesis